jgi:hypothetical protein
VRGVTGALFLAAIGCGQQGGKTLTPDAPAGCVGAGSYIVCFPSAPSQDVNVSTDVDTDMLPYSTQPNGWIAEGQLKARFVYGTNVSVSGPSTVSGGEPLVLAATGTISVTAPLQLRNPVGPYPTACAGSTG